MNVPMMLVEVILAGFFAVACIRACSMVALLLVIRLQAGLPLVLEAIVAVEFLIFLALPTRAEAAPGKKSRSVNAAIVGSR